MSCVPSVPAYVATRQNHTANSLKNPIHCATQEKKSWLDWSAFNYKEWTGFKYIFLGHDGFGLAGTLGNFKGDAKKTNAKETDLDLLSRARHISGSSTDSCGNERQTAPTDGH